MQKFSPKLIKSLDSVSREKYDIVEKECQELETELVKTLKCLIELTIKFEKLCTLTNFTDLESLTVTEEEIITEINKLSNSKTNSIDTN
jgi:hypothetical protein